MATQPSTEIAFDTLRPPQDDSEIDFAELQPPHETVAEFDFSDLSPPAPGGMESALDRTLKPPDMATLRANWSKLTAPPESEPLPGMLERERGLQTVESALNPPPPASTPGPFDERPLSESDWETMRTRAATEATEQRQQLLRLSAFAARDIANAPDELQTDRTNYWREAVVRKLQEGSEKVALAGAADWDIRRARLAEQLERLRNEGFAGSDLKNRVLDSLPFVRWVRNVEGWTTAKQTDQALKWIEAEPLYAQTENYKTAAQQLLRQEWDIQNKVASKALSVGMGLPAFVIELAVLRGMIPASVPAWIADPTAWAAQATGESGTIKAAPLGAAMGGLFKGIKALEQAGRIGMPTALGAESATLMGASAATGEDPEDILIAGLIPPVFRGMANVRRFFRQPVDRATSFDDLIGATETIKEQGAALAARHGELQQMIRNATPDALERLQKVWGPKVKESPTAAAVIDLIEQRLSAESAKAAAPPSPAQESPKSPRSVTKAELLTPAGASEWVKTNPEASKAIIRQIGRTESLPARGAFETVAPRGSGEKWSAAERTRFGVLVQEAVNASKIGETTPVYGNVQQPEVASQGPGQVPVGQGGAGVRPEAQAQEVTAGAPGQVAPQLTELTSAESASEFVGRLKSIGEGPKARLIGSRTAPVEPWLAKMKETLVGIKNRATRAQEFVPNTGEFAEFNEWARLRKSAPQAMTDEAQRRVYGVIQSLPKGELLLFEHSLAANDEVEGLRRTERSGWGLSESEALGLKAELDSHVARSPRVQSALAERKKLVEDVTKELVARNLLPPEALDNAKDYFHREIRKYMAAAGIGRGPGRPQPFAKGFQKARKTGEETPGEQGEELDWTPVYVEAETKWLSDALTSLRESELWQKMVLKPYDIIDKLRTEAAQRGGKDLTWRDLLDEHPDYSVYRTLPGRPGYPAAMMTDKIVEAINQQIIKDTGLKSEDIDVLPVAGVKLHVLPNEIVAQLNAMEKAAPQQDRLLDDLIKEWKVYQLLNPEKLFQYSLRNFSGDADGGLWNHPAAWKFVNEARKETWDYFFNPRKPISAAMKAARDHGVIGSGITTTEIPALTETRLFRGLYDTKMQLKRNLPAQAVGAYFRNARLLNEWRESVFRYASFLSLRDSVASDELGFTYASRADVVRTLAREQGVDVAAAKMARELYGDYMNLTVTGDWARRKTMPFWSWQEVNAKRYARLMMNAFESGDYTEAGKAAATGAAKATGSAAARLLKAALLFKLATPWVITTLYNMVVWPEEERDLSREERANMHIILGRNLDGTIRLWRNMGALNDFVEWAGINTLLSRVPQVLSGQMTIGELAGEMWRDPVNKLAGAVRPDVKGLLEVASGLSAFPDVTNLRTAERDIVATRILGLDDEWRQFKGWLLQNGEQARQHYWMRYFVGISDPRRNALYEMYDLKARYAKRIGKPDKGGIYPISQFRNVREAVAANDYEAYKDALRAYFEDGRKDWKAYNDAVERVDPLGPSSGLTNAEERKFVREFLNGQQRERLDVARNWSKDLQTTLRQWKARAKSDGIGPQKARRTN